MRLLTPTTRISRRDILLAASVALPGCASSPRVEPRGPEEEGARRARGSNSTRFVGVSSGPWRVIDIRAVRGASIPMAPFVDVLSGKDDQRSSAWALHGVASHGRYTTRQEKTALDAVTPQLGRPEATHAALIPIRKTRAWWDLTQDERRAVFEERGRHIAKSLQYLPRIARKLYHARDLGEPFDFLTWFEFAPADGPAFDELLGALRAGEEWSFVEREVELRLQRA